MKLSLIGAAGQIGTPLSLLCKSSGLFDEISLYDLVHVPGIATDLNHIDTKGKVFGYLPDGNGLRKALDGGDIVVVTAGIARKPGMTRDDLFKTNASIIRDIFTQAAHICPKATFCVVTNPVNSTVPVAAQALREAGAFDPARLFGVTTLDVVRASTFVADALGSNDPGAIKVPVIGGHSGATILPLYSQAQPLVDLKGEQLAAVIHRESIISQSMAISNMNTGVQFGGDEIVKSKQGAGSATTCMAYASFRFIKGIVTAKSGTRVIEEAYVYLPGIPGGKAIADEMGVDYFAVKVELGEGGAVGVVPVEEISDEEKRLLDVVIRDLRGNIETGIRFK